MSTTTASMPSRHETIVRLGRLAIATQGILYVVVGLLAVKVAAGDRGADASQKGAIQSVARQPYGKVLLIAVVLGVASHALWRLALAVRGEPGDEDGKSAVKRAANLGRAAIYASFTAAALGLLFGSGSSGSSGGSSSSGGSGGSQKEQQSTALVLSWPGGTLIVMAAGLAVIGAGCWNIRRAITRSFLEKLDCSSIDQGKERTVEVLGIVGYTARGLAYGLIGWFLLNAGRQNDSSETEGLDGALGELASTSYGPTALRILAVGFVLFGAFRVLDAILRRDSEIAWA